MKRIEKIRKHKSFVAALREIEEAEKNRIYCGHGERHLKDVARIAHILNLREGGRVPQSLIYAAALLHDIGRAAEYRDGTPHDAGGAAVAKAILGDCGFDKNETEQITEAVAGHRRGSERGVESPLTRYIRTADRLSRPCYECAAAEGCKWPKERKNLEFSI